jgi:hypothetical protein
MDMTPFRTYGSAGDAKALGSARLQARVATSNRASVLRNLTARAPLDDHLVPDAGLTRCERERRVGGSGLGFDLC